MTMPIPKTANTKRVIEQESLTPLQLKTFMDKHGLAIKEFAALLGITIQCVRLWLNGGRAIPVTTSRLILMFDRYPQLIREF